MRHQRNSFLNQIQKFWVVTILFCALSAPSTLHAEIPYIPLGPRGLLYSCEQEQTRSECRGTLLDADGRETRFRRAQSNVRRLIRKAKTRRKRAKRRGDRKTVLRAIADVGTLRQVRGGLYSCRQYRANRCKLDTSYYSNDNFGEACEAFGSSLYEPEEENIIIYDYHSKERAHNRIVNGSACSFSQSPVVPVDYRGSQYCTGNVIADTVILTAAHCVNSIPCEQLSVRNGDDLRRDVLGCVVHPEYTGGEKHDIALLYLGESIETEIFPIYTENDIEVGEEVLFAGYGVSESDDTTHFRATSNTISSVDEESLEIEYLTELEDEGNTCYGDSGGPLVVKRDGYWVLAGVVSNGDAANCAMSGYEKQDISRWANVTSASNLQFIKDFTENILD